MFMLTAEDEHTRLKSYSATVKGRVSVIKVEVECSDLDQFGWFLRSLEQIEAAQKAKLKSAKAPIRQLALPAPVKALPPPKGGKA